MQRERSFLHVARADANETGVYTNATLCPRKIHLCLDRCDLNMWTTPKPTLGGAGMWDEVRSNGIVQLQHYKPDGTVLAGTLPIF